MFYLLSAHNSNLQEFQFLLFSSEFFLHNILLIVQTWLNVSESTFTKFVGAIMLGTDTFEDRVKFQSSQAGKKVFKEHN